MTSPRLITISNQKGGVGKTTTAVNFAAALAKLGHKVLVIDMDPQGNASTALGIEHPNGTPSSYELLLGEISAEEAMQQANEDGTLWCIPATVDLAGAEVELVSVMRREYRLYDALHKGFLDKHGFDYVFIDCPPSLGLLTLNAMAAVSEVLIPIQCEYYALEGVGQLLSNIDMIREHLNTELHVSAVLLTMYQASTLLSKDVEKEVRGLFGAVVLGNHIPRNTRIAEAPSYAQTVIEFSPTAAGAIAYRKAAEEFGRRGDYIPHPTTGSIGVSPDIYQQLEGH